MARRQIHDAFTTVVPVSKQVEASPALQRLLRARRLTPSSWVNAHASGTLRKNKSLGMAWEAQYREERIAWEFGAGFEIVPRSRILFGPAITEGDCHAVTEAGWFLERGIVRWPFPEDVFQVKYIHVDKGEAGERQGLGVVLRNTSATWLPSGHTVFAIVAEFNVAQKMFLHAVNPW